MLSELCQSKSAVLCDLDPVLYLRDGTVNNGFFHSDRLHLSTSGTDKVIERLGLPMKPEHKSAATPGIRRRPNRKPAAKPNVDPKTAPQSEGAPPHEFSDPFWRKANEKARPNLIYKAPHSKPPPPRLMSLPHVHPSQRQAPRPSQNPPPPPSNPTNMHHWPSLNSQPQKPNGYVLNRQPNRSQSPPIQGQNCRLCLGTNHHVSQCWAKDSQCYSCQSIGHLARACPYAN